MIHKLVQEYQCPGCACGPEDEKYSCYKSSDTITCDNHGAGTTMESQAGLFKILLGLPCGFNRTGRSPKPILIFNNWSNCDWFINTAFNIPVWYHLNESGHTLIRAYQPRLNLGYTLVFGEDVSRYLPAGCIEITKKMIEEMD
jgi:hypothetical protein